MENPVYINSSLFKIEMYSSRFISCSAIIIRTVLLNFFPTYLQKNVDANKTCRLPIVQHIPVSVDFKFFEKKKILLKPSYFAHTYPIYTYNIILTMYLPTMPAHMHINKSYKRLKQYVTMHCGI